MRHALVLVFDIPTILIHTFISFSINMRTMKMISFGV